MHAELMWVDHDKFERWKGKWPRFVLAKCLALATLPSNVDSVLRFGAGRLAGGRGEQ